MGGASTVGDTRGCPTAQPVSVGAEASAGKWGVKARGRGAPSAFTEGWREVSLEGRLGLTVQQENDFPNK